MAAGGLRDRMSASESPLLLGENVFVGCGADAVAREMNQSRRPRSRPRCCGLGATRRGRSDGGGGVGAAAWVVLAGVCGGGEPQRDDDSEDGGCCCVELTT